METVKQAKLEHFQMFIGGEFAEAVSGKTMEITDPGTGLPFATVPVGGDADANAAVRAAKAAFDSGAWSDLSPQQRCEIISEWADLLEAEAPRITMYESMNVGSPVSWAGGGIWVSTMTIRNLAWYAANKFPWQEDIPMGGSVYAYGMRTIIREPIGVCVGIVPWNVPFMIAVWKIAHAIAMGNTIILKPASDTPISALILAETVTKSRIPKGVINVVTGRGNEIGEILCAHASVDKISFTGSTGVGRRIMAIGAETIKKVTLELGGKSANIVLDDADLDVAVDGALVGIFQHSGQICISTSRALVHRKIYDQFLVKAKKRVKDIKLGYQMMSDTQTGPLSSARHLAKVEGYVKAGREEGAKLICGGKRADVPGFPGGFYYEPTIFADVKPQMRIAREEIFGPVLSVIPFVDEDEAVKIANDTIYGLAGGIWSRDIARAKRIAARVKTGTLWINDINVLSDYAPFGGVKQSGIGKEFGYEGLKAYTQEKLLYVANEGHTARDSFGSVFRYPQRDNFSFWQPTKLICGPKSIAGLASEIHRLGCKRAVIITDKGIRAAGLVKIAQEAAAEFCGGVFDDVEPDSGYDVVDRAVEFCREVKADCLISLGGGSSIDTAKLAAVTLANSGKAIENMAIMRHVGPQTPHIAIPTTHGTGSEVTLGAVILNKQLKKKFMIADFWLMPNVAILDAELTVGLPKGLSAGTSMDALSHAIEGIIAKNHNPVTGGMGLQSIRLIVKYLPRVMENGRDLEARHNMLVASCLAGYVTASLGAVHGLAHTVGPLFDVHHGTACGIALPHVMRFNRDYCLKELVPVAEALGVDVKRMSEVEAADAAADAVTDLMKRIGHPTKLSEVGVKEDALGQILMGTMSDLASSGNPRPLNDPKAVMEMIHAAF
jgi:aldehyde dehydrogenase (NAD+)